MQTNWRWVIGLILRGLVAMGIVCEWPSEWYGMPRYKTRYRGWPSEVTKAREYACHREWGHEPNAHEYQSAKVELRRELSNAVRGCVVAWRIWPQWSFARHDDVWILRLRSRYFV